MKNKNVNKISKLKLKTKFTKIYYINLATNVIFYNTLHILNNTNHVFHMLEADVELWKCTRSPISTRVIAADTNSKIIKNKPI